MYLNLSVRPTSPETSESNFELVPPDVVQEKNGVESARGGPVLLSESGEGGGTQLLHWGC